MAALTSTRNTPTAIGDDRQGAVAAGEKIFGGALVMRNAAGDLVKGVTALNLVGVGRAEQTVDNIGGASGDVSLTYRSGVFRFENESTDLITAADIGQSCYAVDDQTVARTSGGATRSKAGVVDMIDSRGVWVCLNEALTNSTA